MRHAFHPKPRPTCSTNRQRTIHPCHTAAPPHLLNKAPEDHHVHEALPPLAAPAAALAAGAIRRHASDRVVGEEEGGWGVLSFCSRGCRLSAAHRCALATQDGGTPTRLTKLGTVS